MTTNRPLLQFTKQAGPTAKVKLQPEVQSKRTVPRELYAKFCEHLGQNIYHGMEAQLLLNCTMARFFFAGGNTSLNRPDGGVTPETDDAQIRLKALGYERQFGLHSADELVRDLADGAAFGWVRVGGVERVVLSPDVGPHGDRAQRVETFGASEDTPMGIAQRRYLPAHRTLGYEYRLVARATRVTTLSLTVSQDGVELASECVSLGDDWRTVTGTLMLPAGADHAVDEPYELSLTVTQDANLVIDRMMLYPDDHVNGADPEVIAMLREAKLPLLRWPGGNFVSAYRWRLGVGPIDARPTLPNPAWEGLEFNTFGTDEFMAFCRAVGCEPMICVNAGDGTPQEAAAWVEYCNGAVDTPMGALRAANGHPEPYHVRVWEVGNELWGRWQAGWTTGGGYVDRYRRYVKAMRAVDQAIEVQASMDNSGGLTEPWNRRLIDEAGSSLETMADHLLNAYHVHPDDNLEDLYLGYMGRATLLDERYVPLGEAMRDAGVAEPHVAITELQLFARMTIQPEPGHRMRPEWLPTSQTISEALYLHGMINAAIRTQGLISMITHSATLNHGGGLRKQHERVWGNPVHYGHVMGVDMAGGTALGVDLRCPTYDTVSSYSRIRAMRDVPALDPMATLSADGRSLYVTLYSRLPGDELSAVEVVPGLDVKPDVEVVTLPGESMADANTLDEPDRIIPVSGIATMTGDTLTMAIRPYQLVRLRFEVV